MGSLFEGESDYPLGKPRSHLRHQVEEHTRQTGAAESDRHVGGLAGQATLVNRALNLLYSSATETVAAQLKETASWIGFLEHGSSWLENNILGTAAFNLGCSVGLAESLWDQLKGLYTLPRTFVLAAQYQMRQEAARYHVPGWAADGVIRGMEAPLMLGMLSAGATSQEEKKDYEEVQALVRELRALVSGGAGNAFALVKKLGGKKLDQLAADCHQYESLMNSGQPRQMYEAGVMVGRLTGEILTAVLLLISVVGAAVRVAKLAASGVQALMEIAALVPEAEGTEIGVAAKTLLEAEKGLPGGQSKREC